MFAWEKQPPAQWRREHSDRRPHGFRAWLRAMGERYFSGRGGCQHDGSAPMCAGCSVSLLGPGISGYWTEDWPFFS